MPERRIARGVCLSAVSDLAFACLAINAARREATEWILALCYLSDSSSAVVQTLSFAKT
jgi:hypothetical protein